MNKIKRVLIKISWESLVWEGAFWLDPKKVETLAKMLISASKSYEVIVICGAWNIWRHRDNVGLWIWRVKSDSLGMMWTLINSSVLCETINKFTENTWVTYSADSVQVPELAQKFNVDLVNRDLRSWKIVLCAWWTWSPFFTTDTAASLRAAQTKCDVILKATKVDWVYDKDPNKFSDAKRFEKLTFDQAIDLNLEVMDQTAFTMCRENNINVLVFKLEDKTDIAEILSWNSAKSTMVYVN